MTKETKQFCDNIEAKLVYQNALNELEQSNEPWQKFLHCNAQTKRIDSGVVLKSYDTIIAIYDYTSETVFDVLRLTYGYTATSAQHITKFARHYEPKRFVRYIPL